MLKQTFARTAFWVSRHRLQRLRGCRIAAEVGSVPSSLTVIAHGDALLGEVFGVSR